MGPLPATGAGRLVFAAVLAFSPAPVGFSSTSCGQATRLKTRAESRSVLPSPTAVGAVAAVALQVLAGQSWVTTWNGSTAYDLASRVNRLSGYWAAVGGTSLLG